MSDQPASPPPPPAPGTVGWMDLTVPDADRVRDFYKAVVGWEPAPVAMSDDTGDYEDYCMMPPGSDAPAGGICHRRGMNANVPPAWLIYITVTDIDASLNACTGSGGTIVMPAKTMGGHGRYAIVQDPAGAVFALFEPEGG